VLWAGFNDVAQRVLTLNKREQRAMVRELVGRLGHDGRGSVLDFGCGTGLFSRTLAAQHGRYVGYDPDPRVVRYASRLYAPLLFTHDKEQVLTHAPYACIVANCCFHHINDLSADEALEFIRRNLSPDGRLLVIDIVAPGGGVPASPIHHLLGAIERGERVRRHDENLRLLERHVDVFSADVVRTHLFSLRSSPLYNQLGIYLCHPRAA
jgi:SAM-dependent methyltransferase